MNREKWISVVKGAGLAAGGAAVAYLVQILPTLDFGKDQVWIAALLAIVLNIVRQYLKTE